MTKPDGLANEGDGPIRLSSAWVFLAITLIVSATIVYVVGSLFDNTDATILAVLVPSTVAIVLTALATGRAGVRDLLRLSGHGTISTQMLFLAALTIPVLALAAIAAGSVITGETHGFDMPSEGLFILVPLVIIAVGEEYGWRGYALPRLQGRHLALTAALIVGAVHWIWHYPPSLLDTGVPLDTPFWLFGLFVIAWSVLMTSIFNASQGSVGLMIVFHLMSNAAFVFFPLLPENRGGELTTFSIFVALSLTASIGVVVVNGPESLATQTRATA